MASSVLERKSPGFRVNYEGIQNEVGGRAEQPAVAVTHVVGGEGAWKKGAAVS